MRQVILHLLSLIVCLGPIFSQADSEEKLQVQLIAKVEDGKVWIRWAPSNMKSWYWGITNGYRLSRYTIIDNGDTLNLAHQLDSKVELASQILPYSEEEIRNNVQAENDQIDLAVGVLYEPSFVIDSMIGETGFARAYADQSDRESRFIFGLFTADQNFEIAKALALAYVDEDAKSGFVYFYHVEFLGDVDSTLLRNGGIEVDIDAHYSLPQPGLIQVEQAIDTSILLVWDISLLESYYSSYNIERSTDSISFTKINTLPLVSTDQNGNDQSVVYFSDDIPSMKYDYYYRVKGVSPFGQEGPSSPIVKVTPKHSPKSSPPRITNLDIVSDDVNVDWDFPSGEEALISGFKIYRAQNALGPFVLIDSVEKNVRTWTDSDPITTGYYRIAAMDNAGVEVSAADRLIQLDDETPPAVPSGLNCIVDVNGLVSVTWSPVTDESLRGYRVFSGNGEEGNFGEETTTAISDTMFQFQTEIQTLTRDLYVKVQSLDERENYSDYSEPCHAMRPDKVPPSKPVLLRANPLVMGVQLEWIHSASSDLEKHLVQRKRKVDSGWTTMLEIDPAGDSEQPNGVADVTTTVDGGKLLDTLAAYPQEYQYRVLALDVSQNQSSSEILSAVPFDSGHRGEITDLEADTTYDYTISSVAYYTVGLTWEYTSLKGLYDFQIYRSVDGKPMRAYKTTNGRGGVNFEEVALSAGVEQVTPGTFSWTDPEMGNATIMAQSGYQASHVGWPVRRTFKYQVMARHFDGGWSPVSEVVEIQVMVPGR